MALVRVNPDRAYVEHIIGNHLPECVDNTANTAFGHSSIRSAVQPIGIAGVTMNNTVAAACCELADRSQYHVLDDQLDAIITGQTQVHDQNQVPDAFDLYNYPNPFNPSTEIEFSLPQAGPVYVQVFDVKGRVIGSLLDEYVPAGMHSLIWQPSGPAAMSSGVYFIRLTTNNHNKTIKAVYVK
ncbi:MAG: T9SS type A sorting domain-containing protein [candidate division KSB1 bacterium]|nr:T9SS type A sorting domain-containing protein [candidate division KSB1 bacterium]